MVLQMEQHESHGIPGSLGLGASVGLGLLNGCSEKRPDFLALVASSKEPLEEHPGFGQDILWDRAKCVDSKDVAIHNACNEARWVG